MKGFLPILTAAKAEIAAGECMRLLREAGGWIPTGTGQVWGAEAGDVTVELHTPFAGSVRFGERHRYELARKGVSLPSGGNVLVVRDEDGICLQAAMPADPATESVGVVAFREGGWIHSVREALDGVPAFVHRDDADDYEAAVLAVREAASRLLPAGGVEWKGERMILDSVWSARGLLPLVLMAAVPADGSIEIEPGPVGVAAVVSRLFVRDAATFEANLETLFRGWVTGDGLAVADLSGAEQDVAAELGLGGFDHCEGLFA